VSTVKIKTAAGLEKFLRILAEESVSMAQAEPRSQEPARQRDIIKRMKQDKLSLSEEDPERAAPEAPADSEPPPAPDKPAAQTPKDVEPSEINPTLDAIIRAIKEIRSGFGADDSAIEQELSNYFDRLDEAEKVTMIVLMRSVGDIMRREATGATAPEPAQYNVVMSMKSAEKATPAPAEAPQTASEPPQAAGSGEDTTPPIKVGEPVSEAYRRRIKDLLSRNKS
jgi:hypothetical protein